MEFVIGAASWALSKALASAKDTLAETWAASKGIGDNFDALEMELLHAQWILDNPHVKQSRSPQFTELLVKLRRVAYDADDVLDELEYYRIQDDLDGTQHATDMDDDEGGLLLHARSTANAIGKRLTCCSFLSAAADPCTRVSEEDPNTPANGRRFFSCAWPSRAQQRKHDMQTQKLKFDRVDMSTKMKNIVDKLKPLCAKLTSILDTELLGSANFKLDQLGTNLEQLGGKSRYTTHGNGMNGATTSAGIIEHEMFGRDCYYKTIVEVITHGEYSTHQLTVLPIVGPGGIGKTTLIQHIYYDARVKSYFDILIWICVSINFNADRLAREIVKQIPKVNGERESASVQELIEQRLKAKVFLLVLDDVWTCTEDEWQKLLAPFKKAGGKSNVIIVTTRFLFVADMVKTVDCSIDLKCLDRDEFMRLFESCVFGCTRPWEDHPELHEIGIEIMKKLKGFPLAARTVGRLLGNQLTRDHWISVLESREWEQASGDHDIMPALKLSYDYLPFHLQQCFSYLAMFPEDYQFGCDELIYLWMGLDILNSRDENRRAEDIGQSYLIDLVDHGFLKKDTNDYGYSCYAVHDLIHELAMKVQSKECIRIHSSNVMSTKIPSSVRHLSIIVDVTDVKHIVSFERYKKDLSTLDRRMKIQNLRTLMLFGKYHGSFAKTFGDLFRSARALRTIFLHGASYSVEDILYNFSSLVHLRYLKIESLYNEDICIPALCRLYHLQMVDLHGWKGRLGSTRSLNSLVNLRYFLVRDDAMYSGIFEVGKLKLLQELRSFEVGKESKGFELSQLEQLSELGGSLAIRNLERTQTVKEASEAKLTHKNHLRELTLEWDVNRLHKDPTHEAKILEVMKPHINLQGICIRGHEGTNCPKWLGENLDAENLESLHLDNVSWTSFPPIGELWVVNEHGEEHLGRVPLAYNRFRYLRRLELNKLPRLKKWVESDPCRMFYLLEVLIITHCIELKELSFFHSICCQQQKEAKINWFPRLRELKIEDCPKLLSFPPIPWTRAPCSAKIEGVGSGLEKLVCEENYKSKYSLEIKMKDAVVSELWNMLAFDNLTVLKELKMDTCPPLPHHHFEMLSSLKTIQLSGGSSIVLPLVEGESHAEYQFPIECIIISQLDASAKELTRLLTYFPKLSELNMSLCEKITGIAVVEKQAIETPVPASSDNKVDDNAEREQHQPEEGTIREEEAEGLLLLPPQLQKLRIDHCPELSLCSSPVNPNREAARTSAGQWLQGLRSLQWLEISYCPKFLSSYSSSSSSLCLPFPTSLERLSLFGAVGTAMPLPLSNLTSLTDLSIKECGDLRGEGLWLLLAHGHLTKLSVSGTPNFFAGSQPSLPHEQEFPSSSSKLQKLWTDDITGVLTVPICTLISSSLTELYFRGNQEVHRFTKEQEEAFHCLTSLSEIRFWECDKLRGLPGQLHRLPNLQRLYIDGCTAIQSLPKGGLPGSLQELVIKNCPAIRSLPKVGNLPSSLLELDVHHYNSKRLRRQCHKLIGTIPIVRV